MLSLMWPLLTPGARTFCKVQQLWMEPLQVGEKTSNVANVNGLEQLPGGYTPTPIPIVFKHFGGWGEEASTFLNKLSNLYKDEEGRNNPSDFKTHWRRHLSVQLQRCNASVLARKMIRVTYGQKAGQSLDVVQLSIQ